MAWLMTVLLMWPLLGGGVCLLLRKGASVFRWLLVAVGVQGALTVAAARALGMTDGARLSFGWLFMDALSAFHLALMMLVFILSTWFALLYFCDEVRTGALSAAAARRFGALWCGTLFSMTLALLSNNLGMMWVGVETSTLMTAFLICVHVSPASLEAMWKYMVMCSVGVACAFMGTLLLAASAAGLHVPDSDVLLWTVLRQKAAGLDPNLLKLSFLFLFVGYGAKAGIAPMHNWLPDAHSQAPAPVSALFSGFLLNMAFYAILRHVAIVEAALHQSGWALRLLMAFGCLSIVVAAAFVVFQKDVKRMLAYSSIEHIGIMALGVGLGGWGIFGALWHIANHAVCKPLAFFSAGRLGQVYGSHHMTLIRGSLRRSPVWGIGLLGALMAITGMAPFGLFMSEWVIAKAAVQHHAWWPLAVFLAGCSIVFIGIMRQAIAMAWGEPATPVEPEPPARLMEWLVVAGMLAALLGLGLWLPDSVRLLMMKAARIVGAGI